MLRLLILGWLLLTSITTWSQNRSRLQYTDAELQAISEYFKLKEVSGKEATAQKFLEEVERQPIVHLATHAEIDSENPLNSALLLAGIDDDSASVKVNELYNLDLQTELTVLSACNTGVGKQAKGVGNMSIAHAFAVSGCPSIVLTQWQVDDEATSKIMQVFYKELAAQHPIDQSLRAAKLEYINTSRKMRAAPYYWAGVNVWGNTKELNFRDPIRWPYYLAGFSILLLCMGWAVRRL